MHGIGAEVVGRSAGHELRVGWPDDEDQSIKGWPGAMRLVHKVAGGRGVLVGTRRVPELLMLCGLGLCASLVHGRDVQAGGYAGASPEQVVAGMGVARAALREEGDQVGLAAVLGHVSLAWCCTWHRSQRACARGREVDM